MLIVFAMSVLGVIGDLAQVRDPVQEYDRVRDITLVTVQLGRVVEERTYDMCLLAMRKFTGKGTTAPAGEPEFILVVDSRTGYRYADDELFILADGHRWHGSLWPAVVPGRGTRVVELFRTPFVADDMASIARSSSIEGAIGLDQFRLNAAQQRALTRFVNLVAPPIAKPKEFEGAQPVVGGTPNANGPSVITEMFDRAVKAEEEGRLSDALALYERYSGDMFAGRPEQKMAAERAKILKAELKARKTVNRRRTALAIAKAFDKADKIDKAIDAYKRVVKEFPKSAEAKEAAERVNLLEFKRDFTSGR